MTPAGRAYLRGQLRAGYLLTVLAVAVGVACNINTYAADGDYGVYYASMGVEWNGDTKRPDVWSCAEREILTWRCPTVEPPMIKRRPLRDLAVTFDDVTSQWQITLPDGTLLDCHDGSDVTLWHGPWTVRCANGEVMTWTAPEDSTATLYK